MDIYRYIYLHITLPPFKSIIIKQINKRSAILLLVTISGVSGGVRKFPPPSAVEENGRKWSQNG